VTPDEWQPFAALIERGDLDGVLAALERLDERERVRLSKEAAKAVRAINADWNSSMRYERSRAAEAVAFGTGGAAAAARLWFFQFVEPDVGLRLIALRPPAWRQDWVERALDRPPDDIRGSLWQTVRTAVRSGLIDRPQARGYVTGAVEGMWVWEHDGRAPSQPLVAELRADPDWLRDELWHLFEVEDVGLSGRDAWPQSSELSWTAALLELSREGLVPRERLLDEALGALRRDFAPYAARWYQRFYEALEPTEAEQIARIEALLALLAAGDPAVVAFALRALATIEPQLPPDELIEAIAPALLVPVKGHAVRAVKLLGKVVKRHPGHASVAAPVLIEALAHESRDVEEAATTLLERHADALGDRGRMAELAEAADASLRPRILALAGAAEPEAAPVTGPAVAVPGRRPVARDAPRLDAARPLEPPADAEELFDRLAVALERDDDPDELELMLDGLRRLPAGDGDPGRVRTLVARALALAQPWDDTVHFRHARDALAVAILARFGQQRVRLAGVGQSPREALAQRLRELIAQLSGGAPRPLLCAPTHAGGWIDPLVAVERLATTTRRVPVHDLAQMVLRLAPDGREDARRAAERLDGEPAAVAIRALGGDPKRPRLSRRFALAWDAADLARDPDAYAAPPAEPDPEWRTRWYSYEDIKAKPADPVALLALPDSLWGEEPGGIERWLTTVWPANREAVYRIVVQRLWLDFGTRQYGNGDVLEALLDPREPVGEQAALAIALALGCSDVPDRALAVDVTIAAVHTRRLDGATLGAGLSRVLRNHERPVPGRWEAALSDVAAASPLAAHDVQVAIERLLAEAGADDRRRLLGVVELLRRLAREADARIADPAAREWLGAIGGKSKIARAAAEALAVAGDGAARSRDAVASL
jgi:hypothetical protein